MFAHSHDDVEVLTACCPACAFNARRAEAAAEAAAVMETAPVAEVTARWKIARGGPVEVGWSVLLQIPEGWAADVAAEHYLNDCRGVEDVVAAAPVRSVTVTAMVRGRTVSGESTVDVAAPVGWTEVRVGEHYACQDVWAAGFIADHASDVTEMAVVESMTFVFDDGDPDADDGRGVWSSEDLIDAIFADAEDGIVTGATLDRFDVLFIDRDTEREVRVECEGQLDVFATGANS